MTRYIVTTIAEARASGKRAAGFRERYDAHVVCMQLNEVPFDDWTIRDGDTCAIIDTSTPLATPAPERRPAAGWREDRPGSQWSLPLGFATARVYAYRFDAAWRVRDTDEWASAPTPEAAQLAAEDAAARLLLAALAELPNARRLMAEALAGREGR